LQTPRLRLPAKRERTVTGLSRPIFFDEGIVAVGDAEARKNVGAKVSISKDKVVLLGETCNVTKISAERSTDYKKYPLAVDIYCKNKLDFLAFFVANSCQKMLTDTGDGVYYILRRQ